MQFKTVNAFLTHLQGLIRLWEVPIEPRLKRAVVMAWSRLFVARSGQQGRISLMGLQVSFLSLGNLRYLFKEIFLRQQYFFKADTSSPFIVDCGSNIGLSVLYFRLLYPDCTVRAFEANPEVYACLESNVSNNRLANIELHNQALANLAGSIDLYTDTRDPGSLISSLKPERLSGRNRDYRVQQVEAVLLSDQIDREVDFLKLDIEGCETEIIAELASADKLGWIKQMVIEYHHHLTADEDQLSRLLMCLETNGFGYQIQAQCDAPERAGQEQDLLIFAYRKNLARG